MMNKIIYLLIITCLSNILKPLTLAMQQAKVSGFITIYEEAIAGTNINSSQELCIYLMGSTKYSVTANTNGIDGSEFQLYSNTSSDTMTYIVYWQNNISKTNIGKKIKKPGDSLTKQQNANTNNENCSSGAATTARLTIEIKKTQLNNKSPGVYSDTLSIMITPE